MTDSPRSALLTDSGRNIGRSVALRLARQGFNNAISPGPIATERPDNPEMARHIQEMVSSEALQRLGTPGEVTAMCGFLCSEDGACISGQMIACNGAGQT